MICYLQNVLFIAFLFSGLLSSTWTTCSWGLDTARVSNVYEPVLFILVFNKLNTLFCDASKACFGFSVAHVFVRRTQIPKTKKKGITVEPWFKKVAEDWVNLFITSRVHYIENRDIKRGGKRKPPKY